MTEFHAPGERSSVRAMKFPAALLTRMSSGPSFQMESIMASTASRLRTSQGRAWIGAFRRKFGGGLFENFFAAAADVDGGSELEEALGHAFAEAGAAAGDEDAFVVEKIGAEHGFSE